MSTCTVRLAVSLSLVSLLGCGGAAKEAAAGPAPQRRPPPVEEWRAERPKAGTPRRGEMPTFARATLKNGLEIWVASRPGLPIVDMRWVTTAGSSRDLQKRAGLAAFAFEMLREGAGERDGVALAEALADLGTDLSISVERDSSRVDLAVVKTAFPAAFGLLADIAQRPAFPVDVVEKVRKSRTGRARQRASNPNALAFESLALSMYGDRHPYGLPVDGTIETIGAIQLAEIKGFWRDNIGPANSAIVVAGDVTLDEVVTAAERSFGQWKGKSATDNNRPLPLPAAASSRIRVVQGPPGIPQVMIAVGRPYLRMGDPDEHAALILNQVLGGMFTSRLNLILREEKRWTYGAFSALDRRVGQGPFLTGASVEKDHAVEAVQVIVDQLARLHATGITTEELASAKASLLEPLARRFGNVGSLVDAGSTLFVHALAPDHWVKYPAAIEAVTAEAVSTVAKDALAFDPWSFVLVGAPEELVSGLEALKIGPVEVTSPEAQSGLDTASSPAAKGAW